MNVNHVFPWMNPHVVHAGTSLREIIPIMAVPRAAGIAKAVFLTFQAEKHKDGEADSNVGGSNMFKHIYLFSHIHETGKMPSI